MEKFSPKSDAHFTSDHFLSRIGLTQNFLFLLLFIMGFFIEPVVQANRPYTITGEEHLRKIVVRLRRETGVVLRWVPHEQAVLPEAYTLTIQRKLPKDPSCLVLGRIPIFPAVNLWNPVDGVTSGQLKQLTTGEIIRWKNLHGRNAPVLRGDGKCKTPGHWLVGQVNGFAWLDWNELKPGVKVLSVDGANPLWDRLDGGYPYWGWVVLSPPKIPPGFHLLHRWRQMRLRRRIARCFSSNRWLWGSEKVTLTAVGDMLFDRGVTRTVNQVKRGYFYVFEKTAAQLADADLTMGNLECPLSRRGQQINMFRGDPEVAEALRQAGFDIVALANNHILDYGIGALKDSINILNNRGITPIGAGSNCFEARRSLKQIVNGVPLAFLAYTEVRQGFTYARVPLEWRAGPNRPGVNPLDSEAAVSAIAKAKHQGYHAIVSVHWGTEYQAEPDIFQQKMARRLIEAGADLIIGHHPHVVQGMDLGPQTVVYSLGNFIFDQKNPKRREGLMLDAMFDQDGLRIIRMHPIRIEHEQPYLSQGKTRRYQLSELAYLSTKLKNAKISKEEKK